LKDLEAFLEARNTPEGGVPQKPYIQWIVTPASRDGRSDRTCEQVLSDLVLHSVSRPDGRAEKTAIL